MNIYHTFLKDMSHLYTYDIVTYYLLEYYCAEEYPYPYLNGNWCCKTKKEKVYSPHGSLCDGSELGYDSKCCVKDNHTPCPDSQVCENIYIKGKFCYFI